MSTLWGVSIFFLLAGLVAFWLQDPSAAAGDGPLARLWSRVWARVSPTPAGRVLTGIRKRLLSNPLYLRVVAAYAAVLSAVWIWVLVIVTPAIGQAAGGAVGDETLRWHYLVLGSMTLGFFALAGAPFAFGRAETGDRQPGTVEPGDVPGRIARAKRLLGAEKITRLAGAGAGGTPLAVEHAEPDLELRIGAIRALARIAQDSERDHIPIMESLCAYVCENTRARTATEPDLADWAPSPDDMTPESRAQREKDFAGWVAALPPLRADIQAALDVIGHRSEDRVRTEQTGKRRLRINLGGARLQRANLAGVRLDGANLGAARLEGADLGGARLEGANLWGARLQGADLGGARLARASLGGAQLEGGDLGGARLERADLGLARLERASLPGARLDGANLNGARLDGADLGGARLEGADLGGARLDGADLGGARLGRANLWGARLEGAELGGARLEGADLGGALMDCANLGGAQLKRANLWGARLQGANLKGAQLEGADLGEARLERADLAEAQLKSADLKDCHCTSASLRAADLATAKHLEPAHVSLAFGVRKGYGRTVLPRGMTYPDHWHAADDAEADSSELRKAYDDAYRTWLEAAPGEAVTSE